ncbi:outer membrane protein OmpK [Photobacterium sanguinicancri]|uniref:outer membrane protein OmpK n=1 Tax=Photobacterium sanguinicancri TaxID=875932 RepID=UPI003D14C628
MRKSLLALTALAATAALPAQAEYHYGFANVYGDYLNWEQGAEKVERPAHYTVGAEGGAGFDWGEIYGFYEYEKLNMASTDRSQAAKFSVHYKVVGDFTAYAQVYNIIDNKFSSEQNRVIGLGYTGLTGDNYWFKPFAGIHDVSAADFKDSSGKVIDANGFNGYMVGWNAGYKFDVAGLPLMVTNWHETELARNDGYAGAQHGETGHNGAVGLWFDITERFYTGVQYRYFYNKLGYKGYGDAMIWRIGMHL